MDQDYKKYSKEAQRRVNKEAQLAVDWVCSKDGLSHEEFPQVSVSDDEESGAAFSQGECAGGGEKPL